MERFILLCAAVFAVGFLSTAQAEADWFDNMDDAQAAATKGDKPILILFTGSDWCPPCKQLESRILDTKEFAKGVEGEWVLLKLEFLKYTKQPDSVKKANYALVEKYGIRGYPTMVVLDSKGELHDKFGYRHRTTDDFLKDLAKRKP